MPVIVCYGDSNTWGYDPVARSRFPPRVRWPGVLRRLLSPEVDVVEEGLPARTALQEDPYEPGLNGLAYLHPCLASHAPVDLVVLMLGTNDLKKLYRLEPPEIARGVWRLLREIQTSLAGPDGGAPKALLLAPPPISLRDPIAELWGYDSSVEVRSRQLGGYYRRVAAEQGCMFLDVSEVAAVSAVDGVHFDAEAHEALGRAVAERTGELLPSEKTR
ncbi:MAG TPA: SGNH/GDSL hydrolase family protein [Anaeromyxobacteraceae bacterium]|nr:SGNH/GDSL hydrolase family protein [Anaeromyxobacteraceae bacterium]